MACTGSIDGWSVVARLFVWMYAMRRTIWGVVLIAAAVVGFVPNAAATSEKPLLVGVGSADGTPEVAQVNFMGYAVLAQVGEGLHQRLRARAFVVEEPSSKIFAFVSVDFGMGAHAVTRLALELLNTDTKTKGVFDYTNLCISGTHTHSSPAGFLGKVLFQITSLGFQKTSYETYAQAVYKAVAEAYATRSAATISSNRGLVEDANINRSPTAYLLNPAAERAKYPNNTDKEMVLLKFQDATTGAGIGMLNWYSVHGTSLNNTNKLVSGDNKGYASYLFEQAVNPAGTVTGEGKFVAAFAATNLGDVSPNINGTFCMDTGLPCDNLHSTCNGRNEMCTGRGPGKDMFDSARIIGTRQYKRAMELYTQATTIVDGTVDMRHTFVDFSKFSFPLPMNSGAGGTNGNVTTCPGAMGYAFAAGTTDGPGMFNFIQATNTTNPFWNAVSDLLSKPTKEQIACQHPKPILLNIGEVTKPYDWAESVVPLQLLRIGDFFIIAVPSEFTTMAGRRMRERVADAVTKAGLSQTPTVVLAGLSNMYGDYTATFEEYQEQRYEGASTIFGPHELEAFIFNAVRLVNDMASGKNPSDTLPAPDFDIKKMIDLLPKWDYDTVGIGKHYGDVTVQPQATVKRGQIVEATFRSANPRNNIRTGGTFLTVEKFDVSSGKWNVVANDGDFATKFQWKLESKILHNSFATIQWEVPRSAELGEYRIQHFNTRKELLGGKLVDFTGTTNSFRIV